jgi:hypothetical protein
MTKPLTPELLTLARYQEGIIGRSQAISAGISPAIVRRRLQAGDWQQFGPGVYATFTGKSTREAKLWIAVLRAGPGAVLSHETAAELHGFGPSSAKIHITIPENRRPPRGRPIPGTIIHRSRAIVTELLVPWRPPKTAVPETVLDLIDLAETFDDAYGWISRALGSRMTTSPILRDALTRRSRIRRRTLITEALDDADEGIDSPLERRYVYGVERAHGLPTATRQARRRIGSGNRYVDNLYEDFGVCVELDGAATHPDEGRWQDTDRDNANIAADDTRTFRFGWVATTEGRCRSAQQVADTLLRNGWTGAPHPCSAACPVGRA